MTTAAEQSALAGVPISAPTQAWQTNLARLERLAEVLAHYGLRARLMTPPGRVPSLHVVNPHLWPIFPHPRFPLAQMRCRFAAIV